MHIPITAEAIRAAAYAFNARFPEAKAEIRAGTPIVEVSAEAIDHTRIRIQLDAFVIAPDGGVIGTGRVHVEHVSYNDGGLSPLGYAARVLHTRLAKADVPVHYRLRKDY